MSPDQHGTGRDWAVRGSPTEVRQRPTWSVGPGYGPRPAGLSENVWTELSSSSEPSPEDTFSRVNGGIEACADSVASMPGARCFDCPADQPTAPVTPPRAATPPTPPAPPAPAVPCAHPVNWTHTGATDNGADGIQIPITWGSSTGRLADLSDCTVREVVNYDPIPNPPFLWNPPNPTILPVPGTAGAGQDTHSYPLGLRTGITNPRRQGTMTAHQTYQFRCTGPGCSSTWTNFPGQTYDIVRTVIPQLVRENPWRYTITKTGTGAGNTFRYSREVAVPVP
jgi:hypothetical protein